MSHPQDTLTRCTGCGEWGFAETCPPCVESRAAEEWRRAAETPWGEAA